jgi:transposase-like protein
MPRTSPYTVVLSPEEQKELAEQSRRYTSPYEAVVRAKAILCAAEGMSNKAIGERLGLPRQIVSKWRKRFCCERLQGLRDRPRRGRPSSFFPSGGRGDQGHGV